MTERLPFGAALVVVGLAAGLSGPARGAPAGGTLFITAEQADTASPDLEKNLKKAATGVLEKREDGQWNLFFVAFFKKATGVKQVNLVFYDTAEKKHEPVNAFNIDTQPTAKTLSSTVTFSADQGFKAGHKYNVMIARLINGKEEIYAKAVLTLK